MVARAQDSAPGPLLLNRQQAERVLDEHGLDGLLAAQPVNVYYLSNYWGARQGVGRDAAAFAVLPRRSAEAAALVLGAGELRELTSSGGTWMPNVAGYAAPLDGATPPGGWPARSGADLAPNELEWLALEERLRGQQAAAAIRTLARAVRAAGLERGVVGIDDVRLERWLRAAGLTETRFVYAEHLIAAIRRIKSPAEIELLRTAAVLNETACLEAAQHIEAGSDWQTIENVYVAELAQRGGRGRRLATGPGGLPALAVRRGAPPAIGARALVAWNGGREAARALRDALPLLADGAAVEVRMAHPNPDEGDPAQGLRRRLEGLGLKVNVVVAAHPEERISDWIRDEAKRTGCDLIVMGLYGHTRMREFVLGGVSRGMLHDPPLPVLISH